jgi:hypothetical protein
MTQQNKCNHLDCNGFSALDYTDKHMQSYYCKMCFQTWSMPKDNDVSEKQTKIDPEGISHDTRNRQVSIFERVHQQILRTFKELIND